MITSLEARQLAIAAATKREGAKEFTDRIDAAITKAAESREGLDDDIRVPTDGMAAEVVERVALLYRANEWAVFIESAHSTLRLRAVR